LLTGTQRFFFARGDSGLPGIDVHSLLEWTVRDPMFWIVFIVMLTLASGLFQVWTH
jgi:hypothetical protein